jgi:hypothetical protein
MLALPTGHVKHRIGFGWIEIVEHAIGVRFGMLEEGGVLGRLSIDVPARHVRTVLLYPIHYRVQATPLAEGHDDLPGRIGQHVDRDRVSTVEQQFHGRDDLALGHIVFGDGRSCSGPAECRWSYLLIRNACEQPPILG